MSQEDTMRLVAELLDKTTGPLKEIQKSLKATADSNAAAHKGGTAQAREHAKAYKELGEQIRRVKDTAIDVVRPGLDALGVTSLTVAGAIAAITSAVKALGDTGQILDFASRRSGAFAATIRGLAEAGQDFGVSFEQTTAGLIKFGEFMDQNARRAPDALNAWNQMPGAWQRIGRSLVGLNREAQINKVLDFIPSVKYQDQRRKLLAIMGLPEDWAILTRDEIAKMRAVADEYNRNHPFAAENAKKSKEAWDAIARSLRGIRDDMGAAFGPDVSRALNSLHGFLEDKSTIKLLGDEFSGIARSIRDTAAEISSIITAVKDFNEWRLHGSSKKFPAGEDPMGADYTRQGLGSAAKGLLSPWITPKALEDSTAKGTKQGLEDFYNSLTKQQGGYTPMAFHPDEAGGGSGGGGGKRTTWGGGGYRSIPEGAGGAGAGGGGPTGPKASGGDTPAGSGPVGGTLGKNRQQVASIAADEWARAGMPKTGIAGVMANINMESRFNPTLRHPDQPKWGGEAHFAHGLYQEGGAEWNHYAAWLSKNHPGADWRDPRLQSRFAAENLKKNYPGVWNRLKNAGSREEAAAAYTSGYLKPAKHFELSRIAGFRRHGVPPLEAFTGGGTHGATLRDHIRNGRTPQTDGQLLSRGMKAVDAGSLNGSASLTIDLNGFPRGTKTASSHEGLFKEVTLNRGRPMSSASEVA